MKAFNKLIFLFLITTVAVLSTTTQAKSKDIRLEVTVTNLTKSVILTPPFVAVGKHPEKLFSLGMPASEAMAILAEGGDFSALAESLEGRVDLIDFQGPILPASSKSRVVEVARNSYIHLASMLLPTNDGFIGLNGFRLRDLLKAPKYLSAYDAGTEENDELCASIPGPQCGGEGYSPAEGEGIVHPHSGIHGESELSRSAYAWGNPVAKISVRVVKRKKK